MTSQTFEKKENPFPLSSHHWTISKQSNLQFAICNVNRITFEFFFQVRSGQVRSGQVRSGQEETDIEWIRRLLLCFLEKKEEVFLHLKVKVGRTFLLTNWLIQAYNRPRCFRTNWRIHLFCKSSSIEVDSLGPSSMQLHWFKVVPICIRMEKEEVLSNTPTHPHTHTPDTWPNNLTNRTCVFNWSGMKTKPNHTKTHTHTHTQTQNQN